MNTDIPLIFLLGGYDLEMVEIKQMLINLEIRFYDEKLHWNNAKLSAYKKFLNNEEHFIGIELQSDIEPPANYTLIDHHNEKSLSPSAIEQVAEILKVQLTRDHQLVAANDKGYIPAMEKLGANAEEIANIRKRDREAQGITDKDEKLAIDSINNHKRNEGATVVIHALTSKFAAITDFLYPNYKSLLIHTDTELTYYGLNAVNLERLVDKTKFTGSVYSGGGEKGYWGISDGKITNNIVNQILNIINMEPFSKHIFLFPFKLSFEEKYKKGDDFIEYLKNLYPDDPGKTNPWKEKSSDNDSDILYNEKKFFHDFVNPAIFDDTETHKKIGKIRKREIHKLEYPTPGFEYKIGIYKKENENIQESTLRKKPKEKNTKPVFKKVEISLNLKKVTLDINKNKNIGVFAFHLEYYPLRNEENNPELSDNVLLINQYGRRIFPPFKDLRSKDFDKMEFFKEGGKPRYPNSLEGAKLREMPDFIKIVDNNKYEKEEDNRTVEEDWTEDNKPSKCFSYIPKHILKLLFLKNDSVKEFYQSEFGGTVLKLDLIPVLDDRMFVLCWMGAEQLTSDFKEKRLKPQEERKEYGNILSGICERQPGGYEAGGFNRNSDNHKYLAIKRSFDGYGYTTNDYWYQFMFVDGLSKTCQNELLQQKLALTHTYDRWVESYSLIGVTRYSFVMMTAPLEVLKQADINAAFLPENFATIYFRMVSLVLLQRSMILDFSDEISGINFKNQKTEESEKNTKVDSNTFDKVRKLYEDYRDFINKIYFREVTAQEQGIELYDMLQEHLRVEKQAKELEKEFDELHRLMNLLNEEESKKLEAERIKAENERKRSEDERKKAEDAKFKYIALISGIIAIPALVLNLLKTDEFNLPNIDNFTFKLTPSWEAIYIVIFIVVFIIYLTKTLMVSYLQTELLQKDDRLRKQSNRNRNFHIAATALVLFYYLLFRQLPPVCPLIGFTFIFVITIPLLYLYFRKNKSKDKSGNK
jgi:hypothetical protein